MFDEGGRRPNGGARDGATFDATETTDTDRLALIGGAGVLALVAWSKRDAAVAAGAPYGLSEPNRVADYGDYSRPWTPTGWHTVPGNHITAAGWITLGVVAAAAVAALMCVAVARRWMRWRRGGGVEAVPPVPAVAAGLVFSAALLVGGVMIHLPFWVACGLAGSGGIAVGVAIADRGQRYRVVAAFTGRADQVLGHGQPGRARVRARAWRRYDDHGQYPGMIEATTGPGWQNVPAELAELGRYVAEIGWPSGYRWRYDPLRKVVAGTVTPQKKGAN